MAGPQHEAAGRISDGPATPKKNLIAPWSSFVHSMAKHKYWRFLSAKLIVSWACVGEQQTTSGNRRKSNARRVPTLIGFGSAFFYIVFFTSNGEQQTTSGKRRKSNAKRWKESSNFDRFRFCIFLHCFFFTLNGKQHTTNGGRWKSNDERRMTKEEKRTRRMMNNEGRRKKNERQHHNLLCIFLHCFFIIIVKTKAVGRNSELSSYGG